MDALWLIGIIVGLILLVVVVGQMTRGALLGLVGFLQLVAGIFLIVFGLIHFNAI